jgi:hypothetical protein
MPDLKPDDFVRLTIEHVTPSLAKGTVGVVRGHSVEHGEWRLDVEFFPLGPNAGSVHLTVDPSVLEEMHAMHNGNGAAGQFPLVPDELAER